MFKFAKDLFKYCFQLMSNFKIVMEKLNQLWNVTFDLIILIDLPMYNFFEYLV